MTNIFYKIRSNFNSNNFNKNIAIIATSTAISQVIVFIGSLILARIFTPTDFGTLQNYQLTISIVTAFATLKFDIPILLPNSFNDAIKLLLISILSVITISPLYLISQNYTLQLVSKNNPSEFLITYIGSIISSFLILITALNVKAKLFSNIGKNKIFQSTSSLFMQIIFGFTNINGGIGLILGDILSKLYSSINLSRIIKSNLQEYGIIFKFRKYYKLFLKYKHYAIFTAPGSLINNLGSSFPLILFGIYYGNFELGLISIIYKLFAVPSSLIGKSISLVFNSELSENVFHKKFNPIFQYFKFISIPSIIILIIIVGIFPIAPIIFKSILGSNWEYAGKYFQILAPMYFISFISAPIANTLNILELQKWQFLWEITRAIATIIIIYISYHYNFASTKALIYYSTTLSIFYITHITFCIRAIKIKLS